MAVLYIVHAFLYSERIGCFAALVGFSLLGCCEFDSSEHLFVLDDVFLECEEEALGVFGIHDNAALYVCLGYTWHEASEVDDHFCLAV